MSIPKTQQTYTDGEEKYSDGDASELTLIHIGKCGGSTVARVIPKTAAFQAEFRALRTVHIHRPFYQKNARYLIVLRNPVARAISAFNWRHKLVVETKAQEFRFSGEYEVLDKYGSINALAASLYDGNSLNLSAVKEWLSVHHLKEDIAYYLEPLLPRLRPEQVFGVMTQEYLNADIARLFGHRNQRSMHSHGDKTQAHMLHLDADARSHLKRFLAADYAAISDLSEIAPIADEAMSVLMA